MDQQFILNNKLPLVINSIDNIPKLSRLVFSMNDIYHLIHLNWHQKYSVSEQNFLYSLILVSKDMFVCRQSMCVNQHSNKQNMSFIFLEKLFDDLFEKKNENI